MVDFPSRHDGRVVLCLRPSRTLISPLRADLRWLVTHKVWPHCAAHVSRDDWRMRLTTNLKDDP